MSGSLKSQRTQSAWPGRGLHTMVAARSPATVWRGGMHPMEDGWRPTSQTSLSLASLYLDWTRMSPMSSGCMPRMPLDLSATRLSLLAPSLVLMHVVSFSFITTIKWLVSYYWIYLYITYVNISCPTGAPAIDLPPEYLDVVQYKAGASVKLQVGIIAKPLPTIEWLKDEKELVATSALSVESTTDTSAVLIKDAARLHTGSYEIKIKNVLGSASATIRIEILGIKNFLPHSFIFMYFRSS